MKKYSIIALALMAGALLGCQKNIPAENPYADAPWAIDESLPVPIQFGNEGPSVFLNTKGSPIENLTDLAAAVNRIHIYAADMDSVGCSGFSKTLLFKSGETYSVPARSDASGNIIFVDNAGQDITRYYPMAPSETNANVSRFNYSFVGYHIPESTINQLDTVVRFKVCPDVASGVDRNADVLYARSDATPLAGDIKGFNAKYIRQARVNSELEAKRPRLQFSHLTSLVHIIVQGDGTEGGDETFLYNNGQDTLYTIKNMKVAVKRGQAALNLITGKISYYAADSPIFPSFYNYNSFDGYEDGVFVSEHSKEYGKGIFMIPGKRDALGTGKSDQPEIKFDLVNNSDLTSITYTVALPLPVYTHKEPVYNPATGQMEQEPTGDSSLRGFVAGRQYTYTIKVKPAVGIVITAEVGGYQNGEFPSGNNSENALTLE